MYLAVSGMCLEGEGGRLCGKGRRWWVDGRGLKGGAVGVCRSLVVVVVVAVIVKVVVVVVARAGRVGVVVVVVVVAAVVAAAPQRLLLLLINYRYAW